MSILISYAQRGNEAWVTALFGESQAAENVMKDATCMQKSIVGY